MEFMFRWDASEVRRLCEWTAQKCAARNRSNDRARFDDDRKKSAEGNRWREPWISLVLKIRLTTQSLINQQQD
jgi:hypothetical protein